MAAAPLDGIRVVDLTSIVLGPYATQIMGDLGADVIKVESPDGDLLRGTEPMRSPRMGAVFMNTNRNKRSVVLDLKQPDARNALLRIVEMADVFIHSLRPKAAARLAITAPDLMAVNPRLIHCSAWGFGSGGPYADKPAYDDIIQAASGIADLARRQGGDGTPPALAPTIMADKTAALHVVYAILAALFQRERTGRGQEVEVPMLETLTSFVLLEHLAAAVFQPPPEAMGYDRVLAPHRRPYATRDGYIMVLPYTTRQWRAFFATAGRPEMMDDRRVTDPATRSRNIGVLYAMVAEVMPQRTTAEWMALMEKADIPATPIRTLEDLLEDPHLRATGFFVEYDHPSEGSLRTTAPPVRFNGRAATAPPRRPPPRLGQHTAEVLAEAGLSADEIATLTRCGAAAG
jgi:crotonobetainyl-CoA:carnitine CoA-transferase CaiB-like acyl-CoA transferase